MTQAQPPAFPIGQDFSRSTPSVEHDPRLAEVIRVSAHGRAKQRLINALEHQDARAVDDLLYLLIDLALDGADARTILYELTPR